MIDNGGKRSTRAQQHAVGSTPADASGVHLARRLHTEADWLQVLAPGGGTLPEGVQTLLDAHMRLQRRFEENRAREMALSAALDRFPLGLFMLGDDQVVATNRHTQVLLGNGLAIESGRLMAQREDQRARLDAEIRAARETTDTRAMCLERDADATSLQLVIVPPAADSVLLLVVAADPCAAPSVACELYRGLFGLTPTEARVAAELVMGRAPREIAKALNVGVETTRTHVKHILNKMGCHRQVDVVRKLVLSPALLG